MTTLKACERDPGSLNEGRDRSPGDTRDRRRRPWERLSRSTKAGTVVPATLAVELTPHILRSVRSTKAGTVVPATLNSGTVEFRATRPAQRRPGP